tara:strand:+ start:2542 stop:3810 length:1269 start_codon:yes stop_codon:yes gene_type:complete
MEETIVFGTPLDLNLDFTTPLTPQSLDTRALRVQRDLLKGEIAALQNQKNMLDSSLDQRIGLGKFLLPKNLYTTNNPLNPSQAVTTSDLNSLIAKKNEELQNVVNQITKIKADFFGVTAPPVKDFTTEIASLQEETKPQVEPDPEPEPEPEPQPEPEPKPKPKPKAQPDINPLFDNPNFGMFLRNIGKSLVETGQMGTGLAVGAARAAEERAVVEKQREVAFQELLQEQVKAGANVETITPNKATEIQTNYVTTAGDYFRTQTTEDLLNTVVGIMKRDDVTGGLRYLQEIGFRLKSAFNMAGEEPSVILVENVLTEIANSQPGDLLGQSSARLSDRDIQLAQDLLGALRGPKKVFKTNEEVLNILNRRKTAIGSEQAERLNLLKLYGDQLTSAGYGIPPIQDFSTPVPQSSSDIAGEANLGD